MTLAIPRLKACQCVYHAGDSNEVYDFIKAHVPRVNQVEFENTLNQQDSRITFSYYAKRDPAVVEYEWGRYHTLECERALDGRWLNFAEPFPKVEELLSLEIRAGSWLLIVDDRCVVMSALEFGTKYTEVEV
jgi:hypothetical protein